MYAPHVCEVVETHGDSLRVSQTEYQLSSDSAFVPGSPSLGSLPTYLCPRPTGVNSDKTTLDSETQLGEVEINIIKQKKTLMLHIVSFL